MVPNSFTPPGNPAMFNSPASEGEDELRDFEDPDDLEEKPVPEQKIDYKAKDQTLYSQWNKTKSKRDLSILLNHLNPILIKEVNRATGTLPTAALHAEAKTWAIKGIKSYDPSKGFALSTHVTNYVQRVRRMNYKYQHVARMPEHMKREYTEYTRGKSLLEEELNRDVTEQELATKLGWSKGKVVNFMNRTYSDDVEGVSENPAEVNHFSDQNLMLNEITSRFTPDEKFIFENKGKLSTAELSKKLGVDINRFNYLHRKLVQKIEKTKQEIGMY